jgi:tripartite-type tricarboxylate transporter receptor subunit TctC
MKMVPLRHAALLALCAIAVTPALAQGWPDKPVTLFVPFPPGGGTDAFARPLSAQLGKQIGKSVVIENRGGAGGTLGATQASRAPKDGYSYFLGAVHHAIAPSVYPKLEYNIEKDFAPISVVAVVPQVVVVNAERVKATTLREFIELAKKDGGRLSYGSAGNGTSHHLAGELFKGMAGVNLQHVPYSGAGPSLRDLVGGQIDSMFDGLGSSAAHIRGGRIRALAVASRSRAPGFPNIPTAAEAGLPGYEVATWYALWGVAGAPADAHEKMGAEIAKALAAPELVEAWNSQGAVPGPATPKEMAAFVSAEIGRWAKVAKAGNIRID